jgi:hypothetical protein
MLMTGEVQKNETVSEYNWLGFGVPVRDET